MRFFRHRRHRGRRRPGAVRDWPVGFRLSVDPWGSAPLFDVALERQSSAARNVTCGRAL
jgi:hypothetical protein